MRDKLLPCYPQIVNHDKNARFQKVINTCQATFQATFRGDFFLDMANV
jgi:hypothetical protein